MHVCRKALVDSSLDKHFARIHFTPTLFIWMMPLRCTSSAGIGRASVVERWIRLDVLSIQNIHHPKYFSNVIS